MKINIYAINYISKQTLLQKLDKVSKNSLVVISFSKSRLFKFKNKTYTSKFINYIKNFSKKNKLTIILAVKLYDVYSCAYVIFCGKIIKVLGEIFDKACIIKYNNKFIGVVVGECIYSKKTAKLFLNNVDIVIGIDDEMFIEISPWLNNVYNNKLLLSLINKCLFCDNIDFNFHNL